MEMNHARRTFSEKLTSKISLTRQHDFASENRFTSLKSLSNYSCTLGEEEQGP
jgi:hypothetical protein